MICKDCIHFEICGCRTDSLTCKYFNDRAEFIRLPCKDGDRVYWVENNAIKSGIAYEFEYSKGSWWISMKIKENLYFTAPCEKLFFNKEDAERALRERGNK